MLALSEDSATLGCAEIVYASKNQVSLGEIRKESQEYGGSITLADSERFHSCGICFATFYGGRQEDHHGNKEEVYTGKDETRVLREDDVRLCLPLLRDDLLQRHVLDVLYDIMIRNGIDVYV